MTDYYWFAMSSATGANDGSSWDDAWSSLSDVDWSAMLPYCGDGNTATLLICLGGDWDEDDDGAILNLTGTSFSADAPCRIQGTTNVSEPPYPLQRVWLNCNTNSVDFGIKLASGFILEGLWVQSAAWSGILVGFANDVTLNYCVVNNSSNAGIYNANPDAYGKRFRFAWCTFYNNGGSGIEGIGEHSSVLFTRSYDNGSDPSDNQIEIKNGLIYASLGYVDSNTYASDMMRMYCGSEPCAVINCTLDSDREGSGVYMDEDSGIYYSFRCFPAVINCLFDHCDVGIWYSALNYDEEMELIFGNGYNSNISDTVTCTRGLDVYYTNQNPYFEDGEDHDYRIKSTYYWSSAVAEGTNLNSDLFDAV